MEPILHACLPPEMEVPRPLPGVAPMEMRDWLRWDDAAAAQIGERRQLLSERRDAVLAVRPEARAACAELEAIVDGLVAVGPWPRGADNPEPLGRLATRVPEDLCILQKPNGAAEHVLVAAVLCFPASWRLDQKIGRPLTAIHRPVEGYDEIAPRVQRLFDGVQPERPLWRSNRLGYANPALHQPRSEGAPREDEGPKTFIRAERQCILRLPETRAVVFSIRTYVVRA